MTFKGSRFVFWVFALAQYAVGADAALANVPDGERAGTEERRAASSHDVRLVAHHELSGRPSYMPHVQEQGGRWIVYVAHHTGASGGTNNGTSILDVTDPARSVLLAHIPGDSAPNDEARSVRVCTFPKVDRWGAGLDILELTGDARAILDAAADRPAR